MDHESIEAILNRIQWEHLDMQPWASEIPNLIRRLSTSNSAKEIDHTLSRLVDYACHQGGVYTITAPIAETLVTLLKSRVYKRKKWVLEGLWRIGRDVTSIPNHMPVYTVIAAGSDTYLDYLAHYNRNFRRFAFGILANLKYHLDEFLPALNASLQKEYHPKTLMAYFTDLGYLLHDNPPANQSEVLKSLYILNEYCTHPDQEIRLSAACTIINIQGNATPSTLVDDIVESLTSYSSVPMIAKDIVFEIARSLSQLDQNRAIVACTHIMARSPSEFIVNVIGLALLNVVFPYTLNTTNIALTRTQREVIDTVMDSKLYWKRHEHTVHASYGLETTRENLARQISSARIIPEE